MADYIKINAQEWLIQNGFNDLIITHPHAGEQYKQYVSDALNIWAKVIIEQTIENCAAHSDSDLDKDGTLVNTYKQFGL